MRRERRNAKFYRMDFGYQVRREMATLKRDDPARCPHFENFATYSQEFLIAQICYSMTNTTGKGCAGVLEEVGWIAKSIL